MPRNWTDYWKNVAPAESDSTDEAMRQVGKTTLGAPVHREHLDLIVRTIVEQLDLSSTDAVVDLGCGNGLITDRVAANVKALVGIDVSPVLIADAGQYRTADNVTYRVGDLTQPTTLGNLDVAKAYSYEVLQHLVRPDLAALLGWLRTRSEVTTFFAGSLPDRDRIRSFYDTDDRWQMYERRVKEGIEQIGTWWTKSEVGSVAQSCGFEALFYDQDPKLYTAHYRFDVVFKKA